MMEVTQEKIEVLCDKLGKKLQKKKQTLVTAESCTGGLLSQSITSIPGSSSWFECGFIVYSNKSKFELLNVPMEQIDLHGAVSESVAKAMANGALEKITTDLSVAITGIAGPGGGVKAKPVGTVYIAWGNVKSETIVKKYCFLGDRNSVRLQATYVALEYLLQCA